MHKREITRGYFAHTDARHDSYRLKHSHGKMLRVRERFSE